MVDLRIQPSELEIWCSRVCELSQKTAAEGDLAELAATRDVEAFPVFLLGKGQVTAEIPEHHDDKLRVLVVDPNSPEAAAAQVSVLHAVFVGRAVVLLKDILAKCHRGDVLRSFRILAKVIG